MAHKVRSSGIIHLESLASGILLPKGTTAQRPGAPDVGTLRFNTDSNEFEFWDGVAWSLLGGGGGGGAFVAKTGDSMTGDLVMLSPARVVLPDSALGSPSLTFSASPSTGISRTAAGVLGINTAGTTNIRIDPVADQIEIRTAATPSVLSILSDGKVGIRAAAPAVSLDISGTDAIRVPTGTTAQRPAAPAAGMFRFNTSSGVPEFYDGTAWQTVVSSASSGTVTSVDVQAGTVGLSTAGGPITTNGTITVSLTGDVLAVENLAGVGFATRIGPNLWATRSVLGAAGRITVTNDDGVGGSPLIDLELSGVTAGTYTKVTVDGYGRATAGATARISELLPPTAAVDWNGFRITGLGTPSAPADAANKSYVDTVVSNLAVDFKDAVRVATTGAAEVAGYTYNPGAETPPNQLVWTNVIAPPVVDGVTLVNGDRFLVKNATDARGNGIFVYDSVAQGFRRPVDADGSSVGEVSGGLACLVLEGTQNAGSMWYLSSPTGAATLGIDNLTFSRFGGGVMQVDTGTGLTGGPIISTGTISLTGQALAFHNLATSGLVARTAPDTIVTRSITGTTNEITVTNGDGVAADPVVGIAPNPVIPGTGALTLPKGSTSQRPSPASPGMIRYNNTPGLDSVEFWNGTAWHRTLIDADAQSFVQRAGDTMLGPLGIIDGTQSNPGIRFASEPDVGLYRPASGVVRVASNLVDYLEIDGTADRVTIRTALFPDVIVADSAGNVGIGAPASGGFRFHVDGSQHVKNDLHVDGFNVYSIQLGLVATGSTLGTAATMTNVIVEIVAGAANTGIRPTGTEPVGHMRVVINRTTTDKLLYPHDVASSINDFPNGLPVTIGPGVIVQMVRLTSNRYYVW